MSKSRSGVQGRWQYFSTNYQLCLELRILHALFPLNIFFLGQCVIWPWFSHSGCVEEQKPLKEGSLFEKQDSLANDNTSKLNISLRFPQHTVVACSAHYVHLLVILFYNLELDSQYIRVSPWKSACQYYFSYFEDLRFICVFFFKMLSLSV